MYLILCYLFLPHQEIRISLNATDALQPLHLVIYWGIITLSLTFSLDNKSNGNHQNPPLSTGFQFSSVQSLGCVQLFAALWAAACQASLSITNSWSLLKLIHWIGDAIEPSHPLSSLSLSSGPITSWQIDWKIMETVTDFIFLGSKITAYGDCSYEINRHLLLGRKAMTNLGSILKSRDVTLPTKVRLVKANKDPSS